MLMDLQSTPFNHSGIDPFSTHKEFHFVILKIFLLDKLKLFLHGVLFRWKVMMEF